jgi:hypothetical protein
LRKVVRNFFGQNRVSQNQFQEHKEVGIVEKVFWCVPIESPVLAWQGHEVYLLLIILVIPGGIMSAAYGAIATKICQCIRERNQVINYQ